MPHKKPLLVLVLVVALAACLLAAGCSSMSTTLAVTNVTPMILSNAQTGFYVTVENTGAVTAENVAVVLARVPEDSLDRLDTEYLAWGSMTWESETGKTYTFNSLRLDREIIGNIPPGETATVSLRCSSGATDIPPSKWCLVKVVVADNADAVVY